MRMVRPLVLALAIGAAAAPGPAEAAAYRLGLGASYWFEESGVFDFTLGVSTRVARHLSVGGRFGAAIITAPSTAAIPLDVVLRADLSRAYLEVLGGPWILFKGDALRGHFAMGFGLRSRGISAGVEVGYLDPNAMLGFKLAFAL
jgi:hypothetical protein